MKKVTVVTIDSAVQHQVNDTGRTGVRSCVHGLEVGLSVIRVLSEANMIDVGKYSTATVLLRCL
jgi:hypothetical protein